MNISGTSALITGGASGLGRATAERFVAAGASVVIVDLPDSAGEVVARSIGCRFGSADVTDPGAMDQAFDLAEQSGPLRILVHCAGRGGAMRLVEKDGSPGSLETFETVVRINLVGTANALRLAAARMARTDPVDGERGVCVLTASVAAYEGQIGQVPYASAKAGVVGMTIVAARDLASKQIRVCTIAPGVFDTPILSRFPESVRTALGDAVPHPRRMGRPEEYAALAQHVVENPMLNGEVIRLDGAMRMAAK